jgi:hypothetical protein
VVEQVLIATGILGLAAVVGAGLAVTMVVRGVRRRYRAARARLLGPSALQLDVRRLLARSGTVAVTSLGSPGWWGAQERRHRMWKAVSSAEHTVEVARSAGVAVGDLPGLARRLHAAAAGVDAVLRAGGRQGRLREEDRADCDRIVVAADELRAAALASLRTGSHADTDTLVSAVRIEVAALASGLRAAHG